MSDGCMQKLGNYLWHDSELIPIWKHSHVRWLHAKAWKLSLAWFWIDCKSLQQCKLWYHTSCSESWGNSVVPGQAWGNKDYVLAAEALYTVLNHWLQPSQRQNNLTLGCSLEWVGNWSKEREKETASYRNSAPVAHQQWSAKVHSIISALINNE